MNNIVNIEVNDVVYGRVVDGKLELLPEAYYLPVTEFLKVLDKAEATANERSVIYNQFLAARAEGCTFFDNHLFGRLWGGYGHVTIPTGYPNLDAFLDGGLRGGLTVIAAPPGRGKSTLALQLARSLCKRQAGVVYICNDMAREVLIAKMLSGLSHEIARGKGGFTAREILRDRENLTQNGEFLKTAGAYLAQTKSLYLETDQDARDVHALEKLIDFYVSVFQYREELGYPPVIILDYLQNVRVDGKGNEREQVNAVVRMLRSKVNDYGLAVIAISSVSRDKYPGALRMNSLKESGLIEYACDLILALQHEAVHNDDYDEARETGKPQQLMELYVLKDRLGEAERSLPITFVPKYSLFRFHSKPHGGQKPVKQPMVEGF